MKSGDYRVALVGASLLCGGLLGCSSEDVAAPGQQLDLPLPADRLQGAGAKAEFSAFYLVVDERGDGMPGAELRSAEGKTFKADGEGRVRLDEISIGERSPVRVEADGYVSRIEVPDFAASGLREQQLHLRREANPTRVPADQPSTTADGSSQVRLPASSLVHENGARATGELEVRVTSLGASQVGGGGRGLDSSGLRRPLGAALGGVRVELQDTNGLRLALADDQLAVLDIEVSAARTRVGDALELATLDEESGEWRLEGSCNVRSGSGGAGAPLVCRGAVSHFSTWSARLPSGAGEGCLSYRQGAVDESRSIEVWRLHCSEERCDRVNGGLGGLRIESISEDDEGIVQVVHGGPSINKLLFLEYTLSEEGTPAHNTQVDGRNLEARYAALDVKANGRLSADLFTTGVTCSKAIKLPTKWKGTDADGDHAFADWGLPPVYGTNGELAFDVDCNDADGSLRTASPEVACNGVDDDCDASTPDDGSYTDLPFSVWNLFCDDLCISPERKEIPGNLYDEDCDGTVEDLDGDGFTGSDDCDDLDPEANRDGKEVAGNQTDENCDGQYLDFDGDGHANPRQAWRLSPKELGGLPTDDCHDGRADVHPGRDPADEAGQLAPFFAGKKRDAAYCGYFDDGRANAGFWSFVRDLNCDGLFTDLDGDGYTSPGDTSLGAEQASDCDDADPRVQPDSSGGCDVSQALNNASECTAEPSGTVRGACPVIFGGARHGLCHNALDAEGGKSDAYLCNFHGWDTAEPLVGEAGAAWGPCDGPGGELEDCVEGYQCAGGATAFSDQLRSSLGGSGAFVFEGMCFPMCDASAAAD